MVALLPALCTPTISTLADRNWVDVSTVVEENTAATEEMSAGAAEVTEAFESIAGVSEENSASVQEISAMILQEMKLIADEHLGVADRLRVADDYRSANGVEMKGYLAWDGEVDGQRPGVLVVHEWWGQNAYARKRAEMLAELGYVALAVDMYGDGRTAAHPDEAGKFASAVGGNLPLARARFEAALAALRAFAGTLSQSRGGGAGGRRSWFRRSPAPPESRAGVYLDGGFGVGKTHLLASLWHVAPEPKAFGTFVELTNLVGALGFGPTVAALTVYDMCKALSHDIVIAEVRLIAKTGGKQDFHRD